MEKTESESISIRINSKIKDSLEKECVEKGITFNKLTSQILLRHISWYTMAEKMDMITMTKKVYQAYIDMLPEDKIKIIANTACKEAFKNYTLLNTGEFTIVSFLETLDLWLTINHMSFEHTNKNDDSHQFVIRHGLGSKFSILLNEIVKGLAEDMDRKYNTINSSNENITFSIENVHV